MKNFTEFGEGIVILMNIFVAFVITYFTIPTIVRMAHYKQLYDYSNERKIHTKKIPRLGGVGIFAGLIISILIFVNPTKCSATGGLLAGLVVLFFVGLKDDILIISPLTKFIGQFVAVSIIVFVGGVVITDFHGFFKIHEVPKIIGYPVTLLIFLITINAFNFIDGVDGLSAGLGIVAACSFALWFILIKKYQEAIIALALVATLIAFGRYNLFSKKIKFF